MTTRKQPGRRRTIRLPGHVRPAAIDLHLSLDPAATTFRGDALYSLRLTRRVRQIELHAADLTLSGARVTLGKSVFRGRIEMHPECETALLHFDTLLPAGSIELELRFRGRVRSDLRGLYRSTDREDPWLASQLCPTDARRLFPCFDEPGIKSRYTIRVTAPTNQTVLSNAPVASEKALDGERKSVQFIETPPLSAYLVAVAVGPFECSRATQCGDTAIRVYTLPGRQPLAAFARKAAAESLRRLERWFGLPHPYPKLDLLALPDFAFGAMENAGAVFFRDSILLLNEKDASEEDRMRAAETIAHELSHMWFGNLVTMAWWNDLWLNESFATWMAYEIVDDWKPEWQIWLEFIQRRESALDVDALASSHPIAPPIRTAEEAHENFDAITYTKGASVLRMLERFLGPKDFREGVRRYIRRHQGSAATAADLWSGLSEVSGLPIEKIVAPWTLQTGYPLIRADRSKDARGETFFRLEQERFLMLPARTSARAGATGPRWTIPWLGRIGQGRRSREIRHLLTRRRDQVSPEGSAGDWLYANAAEAGFFRVDHGPDGFDRLLQALPHLSDLERVGWVGHQWALVRGGRAPIATLFELIAALAEDQCPNVLAAIENVLTHLLRQLAPACGSPVEERLRHWIAAQFTGQIDTLGISGPAREDLNQVRRRARIISIVGGLGGSPSVIEACVERCRAHFTKGRALPRGVGDEIVRIAAASGDPSLQKWLLGAVGSASTPQERRRYLFALAGFDRPTALRSTLAAAANTSLAPGVDRASLLILLLSRPTTARTTWIHLQKVWSKLEKEMPPILLARIAGQTANALPPSAASEIRSFFAAHPLAAGSRVLRQVSEEFALARRLKSHAGRDLEKLLTPPRPG